MHTKVLWDYNNYNVYRGKSIRVFLSGDYELLSGASGKMYTVHKYISYVLHITPNFDRSTLLFMVYE